MSTRGGTWIVMLRDLSESISVEGESRLIGSLVVDADTGLVVGQSIARGARDAYGRAFRGALTTPPEPLAPGPPARVLCGAGQVTQVDSALARLTKGTPLPPIIETEPVAEAEDIFDSLVGHLAGRGIPTSSRPPRTGSSWSTTPSPTTACSRGSGGPTRSTSGWWSGPPACRRVTSPS